MLVALIPDVSCLLRVLFKLRIMIRTTCLASNFLLLLLLLAGHATSSTETALSSIEYNEAFEFGQVLKFPIRLLDRPIGSACV